MNLFGQKLKLSYVVAFLLIAVFLFSIVLGANAGKSSAHAESILAAKTEIQKGLDYFYSDQDRFPSFDEFSTSNIMLQYFSVMPSQNTVSSFCTQNFVYKRLTANSYQLDFCLDAPLGGFGKGWNSETNSKG